MYSSLEIAMFAVRLPRKIEKRLDALAKKTGRTENFMPAKRSCGSSRIPKTII
jgi:hypothetical protein